MHSRFVTVYLTGKSYVVKHNLITEVYLMTVMETTTCFDLYWPSSGCLGNLRASYMHARAWCRDLYIRMAWQTESKQGSDKTLWNITDTDSNTKYCEYKLENNSICIRGGVVSGRCGVVDVRRLVLWLCPWKCCVFLVCEGYEGSVGPSCLRAGFLAYGNRDACVSRMAERPILLDVGGFFCIVKV